MDEIVTVPVGKLIEDEILKSTYSIPKNYSEIKENIRLMGIINPILLNEDLSIISGHLRVKIAKELGLEFVPAIIQQVCDIEKIVLFISSNQQREKTLYDKFQELKLIESFFPIHGGARTDLNVRLKNILNNREEFKKGFTVYEVNTFHQIEKICKEIYGDKSQEIITKKLIEANKKGKRLNSVLTELKKEKEKGKQNKLTISREPRKSNQQIYSLTAPNYISKPTAKKQILIILKDLPENQRFDVIYEIYQSLEPSALAA